MISKSNSFKIISITFNKAKVFESLKKDKNIFYNCVLGLLLKPEIIQYPSTEIVLDKRTIKVSHGESFPDYIKTEIWGQGLDINISCEFIESTNNKMIWFADCTLILFGEIMKITNQVLTSFCKVFLTKDLVRKNYSFKIEY